jgi:hypothetical protein
MTVEGLNNKIFLTDADFEELFGRQITRLVKLMNKAASKICPPCNGYCCKNISCMFYSEYFNTCPIYDRRPRECRYHFCNDVFNAAPLTAEEKDIMQQPIEELICGNRGEIAKLFFLFPEFPLDSKGLQILGIDAAVRSIKDQFETDMLDEEAAFSQLKALCNK